MLGINGTGETSMSMGRPNAELVLSEGERSRLTSIAHSRSISAALVTRARIVLAAAAGAPDSAIAQRLELKRATVGKWRIRFLAGNLESRFILGEASLA
jgi:putative transposase